MTTPERLERAAQRMLLDLLLECSAAYWRKRADEFAAVGTEAADEIARACWAKARFVEMGGETEEWAELLDRELSHSEPA